MTCVRRREAWTSRLAAVVGDPRTVLLALVGVVLLGLGIGLDQATLLVVGPAALLLAVVLSVAVECLVGGDGLSFRADDREASYKAFVEAQLDSVCRTAVLLCGHAATAALLAKEALARSYLHWDGDRAGARVHALCVLVRLVLAGRHDAEAAAWEGPRGLAALSPYERALVVLRDDEQLPWATVAAIVDRSVDDVQRDGAALAVRP